MPQSKKSSLYEAVINTVIGYGLSVATYAFVMPLLGYHTTLKENVTLVAVFSAISIVRNYCIRRVFARRAVQA
jgi:hypothetical protein